MRKLCFVIALTATLASAQTAPGAADKQDAPVFKSDVALVKVDAEVLDAQHALLAGFRKEDFRVLDNGTPQDILYFSQGEVPLDVLLLFDISSSMAPKLRKVAASAHAALAELKPGDRAAVMIFWRKTELITPFTSDLAAIENAINGPLLRETRGGTHILGAINDAADYIRHQPRDNHRRAIVIVTDNHGQMSGKKNTAVKSLWEADAVLCGLQVRFKGETALLVARRVTPSPVGLATAWLMDGESMTGVAEKTGGDLLKGDDAGAQFTDLMHRLRARYSLYYAMPAGKAGEERHIKVQLADDAQSKNPQSRVLARSGYHLPGS